MTTKKKQPGPKGFILVDLIDKGNIVEIPLTSNKAWLTLFYALPEELVSKAKSYLDFPRCPYEVLRTDKYDELVNDDIFLELVWDCTAWAVWQYFEVPDKKKGGYREIPGTDKLSKYHNTTARIVCNHGETLIGACEWFPPEYGLCEFGLEEESLRIGEYMIFDNEIREIEILRWDACFPVRDWPEAKEEIAEWFHEKWQIPLEAYRESIRDCLRKETGIPQWYVVVRGSRIIAGCGVIRNDSHERNDLAPNVCAVYVDEEYRNQGVAGAMLQYACKDMSAAGFNTLYLLTDLTGFYERYGWKFLCMVRRNSGELSSMYVHHTELENSRET